MKKWYIIAGILVVLLLTTGCIGIESPEAPPGKIEVLSYELIKEDSGVKVKAIVKNVGMYKIDFAQVTVKFYDDRRTLLDTAQDAIMNLKPSETWTFILPCLGPDCEAAEDCVIETMVGTSSGIR